MTSLQEHLERHDAAARTIPFRRDCPLCRAERVQGRLPSATLVSARASAAVTAVILAASAVAPGAVVADGQGVAIPAPPSPPPPPVTEVDAGGGAAPADGGDGESSTTAAAHEPAGGSHAQAPPEISADGAPASDGDTAATASDATTAPSAPATATGEAPPPSPPPDGGANGAPSVAPSNAPAPAEAPAAAPAPTAAASQNAATASGGGQPPAPSRQGAPRPSRSKTPAPPRRAAPVSHARTGSSQAEVHRARTRDRSLASAGGGALARHSTPDGAQHRVSGGPDGSPETGRRDRPASSARTRTRAQVTTAESQAASTYRVQPGDSLWRIASRHLGADATDLETAHEVSRLWKLNEQRIGTGNPDLIFPGQALRM